MIVALLAGFLMAVFSAILFMMIFPPSLDAALGLGFTVGMVFTATFLFALWSPT